MDHEQTEQARELHRTLEFIGLRAQATTVGMLQLCAELVRAGSLQQDAIERIKQSIFREIAVNQPTGYNRAEFERTLKHRLDAIFPSRCEAQPNVLIGTVEDMQTSFDTDTVTTSNA